LARHTTLTRRPWRDWLRRFRLVYNMYYTGEYGWHYTWRMTTITVRADSEVERALAELTSDGRSQSAVIREAILAAWIARRSARLRAEAEDLAADPEDRAEMRAVQADLESLRAW